VRVPPGFGLAAVVAAGAGADVVAAAAGAAVGAAPVVVAAPLDAVVGCGAGALVGAAVVAPGAAWHADSKVIAAPTPTNLRKPLRLLSLSMSTYSHFFRQNPHAGFDTGRGDPIRSRWRVPRRGQAGEVPRVEWVG